MQGDDLKRIAVEFYNVTLNEKNFEKTAKYLAPKYIQHSPTAKDGAEGLKEILGYLKQAMPDFHADIKRVFVDGNYVILHVHTKLHKADPGLAIIDIIRFDDNGKVAEHWDVSQQIPEQSANSNTMF